MVISCRFPTHAILSVDAPWVVGSQLGYSVSLVCAVKHTERTLHKRIVYSPAHAHVNIQLSQAFGRAYGTGRSLARSPYLRQAIKLVGGVAPKPPSIS